MRKAYASPLQNRLRRIEHAIETNKPELKHVVDTTAGNIANASGSERHLTDIGQGSGVSTRNGNEICMKWMEFRGYIGPGVDVFVIQCLTTSIPSFTDFTTNEGCMLTSSNWNTRFRELCHFNCSTLGDGGYFKKRINLNNMIVKYNGSSTTNDVTNRLYIMLVNNTGASAVYTFNVRLWFTDA